MQNFIAIIFVSLHLVSSATEWVEISQKPKPVIELIHSTSSIKLLKKNVVPAAYQDNVETSTEMTPSPYWVQYQRERYRNQSAPQGLIVSTGQHLKNSAQIVVPAIITSTVASVLRNKIFHTKTRLNVAVNDKNAPNNHVETTSRREMPDMNEEMVEEESVYDNAEQSEGEAEEEEQEPTELQMPSINGFFKFLKNIQSAWWKKTGLSFENKILTLKKLRDNLMRVIENQLRIILLPDRTSEVESRRVRRGILDESSLNFPPEAALMSINFLTFAVFLIKLVLQVVHIVKSKHYSFSGLNVNAEPVGKVHAV